MRVAMYYSNRDVRLEELPVPKIGAGEFLLRTRASGICGSDLMEWYRIKKVPLVLGHEITAEVAEVGESVEDFSSRRSGLFYAPCPLRQMPLLPSRVINRCVSCCARLISSPADLPSIFACPRSTSSWARCAFPIR